MNEEYLEVAQWLLNFACRHYIHEVSIGEIFPVLLGSSRGPNRGVNPPSQLCLLHKSIPLFRKKNKSPYFCFLGFLSLPIRPIPPEHFSPDFPPGRIGLYKLKQIS